MPGPYHSNWNMFFLSLNWSMFFPCYGCSNILSKVVRYLIIRWIKYLLYMFHYWQRWCKIWGKKNPEFAIVCLHGLNVSASVFRRILLALAMLLTDALGIFYKNHRLKDECKVNTMSIVQHNFRILRRYLTACFTELTGFTFKLTRPEKATTVAFYC